MATSNNRYPSEVSAVTSARSSIELPEQNSLDPERRHLRPTRWAVVVEREPRAAQTPYEACMSKGFISASAKMARASPWPSQSRPRERSTDDHRASAENRSQVEPDPGNGRSARVGADKFFELRLHKVRVCT